MTPEKKFEQQIIAELTKRGWFAHHFDANGVDGWPDILAINGTRFKLIEVKAGTALRPAQRAFHAILMQKYDIGVNILEQRKGAFILNGEVFAHLDDTIMELLR